MSSTVGTVKRRRFKNGHQWRAVADNYETIAGSTQGYSRTIDREHSIDLTLKILLSDKALAHLLQWRVYIDALIAERESELAPDQKVT